MLPLGLALPLLLPAGPLAAQTPAGRQLEHVRLPGVHALPPDLVRQALPSQATRCKSVFLKPFCWLDLGFAQHRAYLDTTLLARDTAAIHRIYLDWGYPDAHATFRVLDEGAHEATVVFRVAEGAPVRVRSLRVDGLAGTGVRAPPLPLHPGEPYAPVLLDASENRILLRLAAAGRPFGEIEVAGDIDPATGEADVVLDVRPGPVATFGSTTIQARPPLNDALVERRIAWRKGGRFDPAALARTRERLARLPIVDTARVVPLRGLASDSTVDVSVTVTPGRVSAIQGEGGISSGTCLSGRVDWSDRFVGGRPRVLTIGAGAANLLASGLSGFPCSGTGAFGGTDYFVRGAWSEPAGADTWLLLSADYLHQTAPGAFVVQGVEGRLGVERIIGSGLDVRLSYAPSRTRNTAGGPFFCALFGACAGSRLDALQGRTTVAPLAVDVAWAPPGHGPRLHGPEPGPLAALTGGGPRWLYDGRLSLSGAGPPTLSAVSFLRAEIGGSLTRLLGRRLELAARLRLGGLHAFGDTLPPQLRFFGGGAGGVRGARQNLLGPKLLVVDSAQAAALACGLSANGCAGITVGPDQVQLRATGGDLLLESTLEARLWLSSGVQLAAFLDYGYVHSGALSGTPAAPRPGQSMLSPGVGLRLATPVGPLRLDFAYDATGSLTYPLLAQRPDGTFLNLGGAVYDPYAAGGRGGFAAFRRHVRLQFSLGQPF